MNIDFIKGSIENLDNLYQKTLGKKIDIVIHLAAFLGVRNTERDKLKCLNTNILGTINVLNFCKKKKLVRLFFHPHRKFMVRVERHI